MSVPAWVAITAFNSPDALDACLAALDRTLPTGHPVRVVDDASTDARVPRLLEHWRSRTRLDARIEGLPHRLGPAANANAVFAAAGDADVVLLAADAVATVGWLEALQRTAECETRIATVSPWSNGAGLASWPRPGEASPMPGDLDALAEAAASLVAAGIVELPVASAACTYVRRAALTALGGFDAATLGSVASDDFSRRAAAMGWRNVLCEHAFVARVDADTGPGPAPARDELPRLLARWPDYHEQVARFLLDDPLRPLRERLAARLVRLERGGPQRGLFDWGEQ
ncbi:MAG: glycosyltransferase family 2 protein [Arenimonas sp.]